MAGITQSDVLSRLASLRGMQNGVPNGTNDDWKRNIQDAFDYAWRYYPWGFSKKTAVIDMASAPYMPSDFDYDGWHEAAPISYSQRWMELPADQYALQTSGYYYNLAWDDDNSRYAVNSTGGTPTITITYQKAPPTLDESVVPFPSAMAIAMGANIFAKYGANPTSADAQQQWDMFHAELDRLSAASNRNRPRGRALNIQDVYGTYPGDTR